MQNTPPRPSATIHLAILDTDEPYLSRIRSFSPARGYRISVHPSSRGLFESLEQADPADVVLLADAEPGVDYLSTLTRLRALVPHVPVIVVSCGQAPATIVDAVRGGAADYVVKSNDAAGEIALEAAIREALSRASRSGTHPGDGPGNADDQAPGWKASAAMRHVADLVERVAGTDVGVLLHGESGVGKEVVAKAIVGRSSRREEPFIKVNCAALPSDLLESELFGHERGAFTGAGAARIGRFESAQHGTILLDEIGEMPLGLQAKLLQVLQDGEVTRLGSNRGLRTDARVVAATNRDLLTMMRAGTFREDLYYRLQVVEIHVPPLRERVEEIGPLTHHFLARYARAFDRPVPHASDLLHAALRAHRWPGNVRELENMMQRFVVLQDEALILDQMRRVDPVVSDAAPEPTTPRDTHASAPTSLDLDDSVSLHDIGRTASMDAERDAIAQTLTRFRWNRRKSAAFLQVSYKTLLNKIKECGIESTDIG